MNIKAVAGFLLSVGVAVSQASLLGVAGDYNVFSFGDVDVKWSDAEGKVAGLGNVTVESYRIGANSSPTLHSLIGGGDVDFKGGEIHNGGIYAGGNATIEGSNVHGDVHVKGDLNINGGQSFVGDLVVNGSARFYEGDWSSGTGSPEWVESSMPQYLQQKVINADPGELPIDFASAYNQVSTLSSDISSKSTTGIIDRNGNEITLRSTGEINYFNLTEEEVENLSSLTLDLEDNSVAFINVSGIDVRMGNFQFFNASGSEFRNAESVLFNFHEADNVVIGSIGVEGSILAMNAHVDFNEQNVDGAYINGNVVAGSIAGTGEFHSDFFDSPPPQDVPEPATLAFLSMGALLLGAFARKKKIS